MVLCRNCGKETKNKKYCSRECYMTYKFQHQRKHRSKFERSLLEKIKQDFSCLCVVSNDRRVLPLLELDIYVPALGIAFEINGIQHYQFVPRFHRTMRGFLRQKVRDEKKQTLCQEKGIKLVSVPNLKKFSEKYVSEVYEETVKPILEEGLLNAVQR